MAWGKSPFDRDEMVGSISEFEEVYASRPIRDNAGGMKAPHAFGAWYLARKLKPRVIIESGVFHGQGTWFLSKGAPEAEFFCLDPNIDQVKIKIDRAKYFNRDFSRITWDNVDPDNTLVFFDDHQNALDRLMQANFFGFRHVVFEDNYPPRCGDCFSLKAALMGQGFPSKDNFWLASDSPWYSEILKSRLDVYAELPPPVVSEKTRWGEAWTDDAFPTPRPLFTDTIDAPELFRDEAFGILGWRIRS